MTASRNIVGLSMPPMFKGPEGYITSQEELGALLDEELKDDGLLVRLLNMIRSIMPSVVKGEGYVPSYKAPDTVTEEAESLDGGLLNTPAPINIANPNMPVVFEGSEGHVLSYQELGALLSEVLDRPYD